MTPPTWRAPLRALPGGRSTRAASPAWARAEVRALDDRPYGLRLGERAGTALRAGRIISRR